MTEKIVHILQISFMVLSASAIVLYSIYSFIPTSFFLKKEKINFVFVSDIECVEGASSFYGQVRLFFLSKKILLEIKRDNGTGTTIHTSVPELLYIDTETKDSEKKLLIQKIFSPAVIKSIKSITEQNFNNRFYFSPESQLVDMLEIVVGAKKDSIWYSDVRYRVILSTEQIPVVKKYVSEFIITTKNNV